MPSCEDLQYTGLTDNLESLGLTRIGDDCLDVKHNDERGH